MASLRQRLGRSGRRKGEPAILRGYAIEKELNVDSDLSSLLRVGLVQSIAMIRLLIEGWYEPVPANGLHASTFVQQLLSAIAQFGGLHAGQAWFILCGEGPFSTMSKSWFVAVLRCLAEEEVIFQDPTGLLLLAPKGERITEHYSFYAAFSSEQEFRIVTQGRTLGSMSVNHPLAPGGFLIFAGRRWEVISLSQEELVIEVAPSVGGKLPDFNGGMGALIHDRVREEMREVLRQSFPVPFLDEAGQAMLNEARDNYRRLGLDQTWLRQSGSQVQLLLWKGDRIQDTLVLLLTARGFKGLNEDICIGLSSTDIAAVYDALLDLQNSEQMSPLELASTVKNLSREKWDLLLPEEVLQASFASSYLDVEGTYRVLDALFTGDKHRVPLEKQPEAF